MPDGHGRSVAVGGTTSVTDGGARTEPAAGAPAAARRSQPGRRLRRNGTLVLGLAVVTLVVAAALLAPVLAPHDYAAQQLPKVLLPPAWDARADPAYPLGTDHLGRDLLSRILYGARTSLLVGAGGVLIAGTLGVALGLLAGYFGGWTDDVITRLVDIQLSFPPIFLVIAIMAVVGQSLLNVVVVLGLVTWVQYARVVRGSTLSLKEKEFVEGARALGAGHVRIVLRHILPNILPTIVVIGAVNVSTLILAEASLSFLGLGVQPPTPAWGTMLAEGREVFRIAWWNAVFPGLAILITVLGVNLLGDGVGRQS
jgi:peptide/nickel transport system permease protein